MTTGIYKISIGNLHYIGQSKNIERRWRDHQRDLDQNKHCNHELQRTFNNSNQSPVFKIIKRCFDWNLDYWERELGDRYSTCDQKLPAKQDRLPWGIITTIAFILGAGFVYPLLPKSPTIAQTKTKQVTAAALANIRATPNGTKLRTVSAGTILNVTTIDPNGWWAIQGGGFVHRSMVK